MIEIRSRLPGGRREAQGQLSLPFASRQKSRLRTALVSGEEVALALPRGEVLRGGDFVAAADGRVIEVLAAPEDLVHIECATPVALAKAAYHLGNRHVPVQVGEGFLRIAQDHVLEEMLCKLGARLSHVQAAFEPEAGAYGGGHRHDEMGHGGKIHEFGAQHEEDHHHAHGDHSHDHR